MIARALDRASELAAFSALAAACVLASGCDRSADAASPRLVRPVFAAGAPAPRLDLTQASGEAQRAELKRLVQDPAICREALAAAGVRFTDLPPEREGVEGCGFTDALVLEGGFTLYSAPLQVTCPLAAHLFAWEFDVVAPAAERHFGVALEGVVVLGSYSCRRRAGDGRLSQHAFARAADIAGFRLADGRTIPVEGGWWSDAPERRFLREVHAGACRLFDVTLGPAYDAAHADHFHVDVGGGDVCR